MALHDAAFLEEVEGFLVSFGLPIMPALDSRREAEDSTEASPSNEVSPSEKVKTATPVVRAKSSGGRRKKTKQQLDPVARHELEKEKDRKRRTAYRERRKVEKETLQQQIGELTTELTELQRTTQANMSLTSSTWEMVAKRQLQDRVDAEEKQRRLIKAVEFRATLIQEFQGAMHGGLTMLDGNAAYKHKRIRLEPSDAEFYKAYVQELDDLHAQTDENMRNYGLDLTDTSWDQPKRYWKEEGETGYYLHADKKVMAFDFRHVCRFSWHVAQVHHRQEDREHFDGVDDPENTSAFKFRITTQLSSGKSVSVLQRTVIRRYVSDERSVVVWRSFSEGEGMFLGMHADESGLCVSSPSSSSPESSTLLRTMMRYVPMHFSSKCTNEIAAQEFASFVFDSGSEDALEIGNMLESLLLQDK